MRRIDLADALRRFADVVEHDRGRIHMADPGMRKLSIIATSIVTYGLQIGVNLVPGATVVDKDGNPILYQSVGGAVTTVPRQQKPKTP